MIRKATYNRVGQLIAILVCAFALKHFYSTAGVNELRWILAPTTTLVELVSGASFNFESHAGYMSSDRRFLIAASCAGVNFLITAFLMLSLARLWKANLAWKFIPSALVFAYVATLVANTVRIATALQLQQTPLEIGSLSSNQIHRLEGILIYFGFLLLLFLIADRTSSTPSGESAPATPSRRLTVRSNRTLLLSFRNATQLLGQFFFPLLIYYTTTLGMPLANAAYRREIAANAFWEHSLFVLLAPLLFIVPVAAFRCYRAARRVKAQAT